MTRVWESPSTFAEIRTTKAGKFQARFWYGPGPTHYVSRTRNTLESAREWAEHIERNWRD